MKETWLVDGSSVGLGRSIAEAALAEGHDVVASARCARGSPHSPNSMLGAKRAAPNRKVIQEN